MTAAIVVDASAAVEIITRTQTGVRLQSLIPAGAAPWVPDGLFDAEVLAVLRRWDFARSCRLQTSLGHSTDLQAGD